MPAQDGRTGIRRRVQEGQASWARTCTPLARRRTSAATSNGHPAQRLPPKVTPGRLRGNLRSIWLPAVRAVRCPELSSSTAAAGGCQRADSFALPTRVRLSSSLLSMAFPSLSSIPRSLSDNTCYHESFAHFLFGSSRLRLAPSSRVPCPLSPFPARR